MRGFYRADSIVRLQSMIRVGLIWGRCNILPCQCIDSVRKWLGNHFYFSKATTPIRGLVFSHSYVNNALVSILITYLTENWRTSNFAMAALVTNVQEGVSDILVIVIARISDTHMTRFKMIVSTNAAYFLGLLLLFYSSKFESSQTVAKVYYGAVVLIVLGEAGRSATLKEFLENQYFSEDKERPSTDKNYLKRLETRKEALWHHPWFLGALLAVFLPTPTWTSTFMVSTILVGVSYLLFLLGYSCYFLSSGIHKSTWKSRLCYLKKLSLVYPVEEQEEEEERGGEICIVTRVTSSSSSSCPPEEAQRKKFWPLIELKAEKGFFIEVIAMWSAFFAYSLVEATGSTFFFEQMSSLDTKSGIGSVMVVAVFFTLVSRFSSFLVSFIYDLLIPKQWRKATLVRIGCGLACSMLCCVAAWLVEGKRLKSPVTVTNQRIEGDTRTTFAMSTWWLIPQFVQLGLMEGLALNGLTEFLADRIANNDRLRARYYYASHISDLILGVGKLVTASSILVFRRSWFHPNINGSHLDRFFELLTYLSLANLIYYMCISVYFYHNEKSRKSANKGNKQSSLLEQVEQGIHAAEKEADVEEAPVPVVVRTCKTNKPQRNK
ncbi:protein NRT1/ PTR FAMILY 5.10-like [Prunus yedoensis var. nudiflora]|uniref:Protein NRT1/ PTR FAMILY 5.10-like n=1 Tax=Prunus yedoensis var. nudiflora TaxID=2094558 RepID=A0A314UFB5_PRUYE|nr:protein NRT1/ PTR FAMILY 5.10-like [Prunus yedoensis var. nudiflora]